MRWIWKRWGLISLGFGVSLAVILTLYKFEWTGFGQGESVSTMTNKRDVNGNIVETTTTNPDPRKNLWDWLSLLGVPLTLAILGYILQQQERDRAEALSKEEKRRAEHLSREQRERDERIAKEQHEIAANEAKEEILQVYFDRLSTLLVDKNILAIAASLDFFELSSQIPNSERELFDSAVDVIRARTLSILRRFEGDSERKTSVIRFLIEADVIGKAKLSLKNADLSGADLNRVDLKEVDLREANLSNASLIKTNLSRANLNGANLNGANLSGKDDLSGKELLSMEDLSRNILSRIYSNGADLINANLSKADLSEANLSFANLRKATLFRAILIKTNLINANLNGADLSCADLRGANLSFADLDEANLYHIDQDNKTRWPDPTEVAKAKNIPEALKQQLDLPDTPPLPDSAP